MADPILFRFDFTSPYAYLADTRIDAVAAAAGRTVTRVPILLGAVFKETGARPLLDMPLKGAYARHDLLRTARTFGVPFTLPDPFPYSPVAPSRAFLWLQRRDPALATEACRLLYRTAFGTGTRIDSPERTADALAPLLDSAGIAVDDLTAGMAAPDIKSALRAAVETAIADGVCGAPFFTVDGEPWWGVDRLPEIEKSLRATGS